MAIQNHKKNIIIVQIGGQILIGGIGDNLLSYTTSKSLLCKGYWVKIIEKACCNQSRHIFNMFL